MLDDGALGTLLRERDRILWKMWMKLERHLFRVPMERKTTLLQQLGPEMGLAAWEVEVLERGQMEWENWGMKVPPDSLATAFYNPRSPGKRVFGILRNCEGEEVLMSGP